MLTALSQNVHYLRWKEEPCFLHQYLLSKPLSSFAWCSKLLNIYFLIGIMVNFKDPWFIDLWIKINSIVNFLDDNISHYVRITFFFLCVLFFQFLFTVDLFAGLCTAMKFDVYQKVPLISKTSWQFCKFFNLLQFLYKWRQVYYESSLHLNMETFQILAYCLIISYFFFGGGGWIWNLNIYVPTNL